MGSKKGTRLSYIIPEKPSTRPSISDMRDLTNCSDHLHSTFGLFVLKNKPCLYKRSACRLSSEKGGEYTMVIDFKNETFCKGRVMGIYENNIVQYQYFTIS